MKKLLLLAVAGFISLSISLPLVPYASAEEMGSSSMDNMRKKRYRYRNRTHRVQVSADLHPWSQDADNNLLMQADLLYGYNAGLFEVGPNVSLEYIKKTFGFAGGIWGEFNFIKNTRKEKFVPALGVKVNYIHTGQMLFLAPYLALKLYPASRTGLIVNLNYNIVTPFSSLFKQMKMGINVSIGYAHYFHF